VKGEERDVWLRGGEKEYMYGDSFSWRFENLFYERTSKAKEDLRKSITERSGYPVLLAGREETSNNT
jgi:3'-phosphoadenosine 5'-phosphosulfate sulfotransferase